MTLVIVGIVSMVIGALLFAVGWVLNTQTPIQQPLPVVGIVVTFLGLCLLLVALGRL